MLNVRVVEILRPECFSSPVGEKGDAARMGDINHVWNCQHIFEMDRLRRKLKEREDEIDGLKRELGRMRSRLAEKRSFDTSHRGPDAEDTA